MKTLARFLFLIIPVFVFFSTSVLRLAIVNIALANVSSVEMWPAVVSNTSEGFCK